MSRRLPSLLMLGFIAIFAVSALTSCASNDISSQVLQAHVGITGTFPANGATDVPLDVVGGVGFLDTVDEREAAVMSFTLADAAGHPVAGEAQILPSAAGFVPSAPLAPGTAYRFSLTTGVRMVRGKLVRDVYEWNFSTVGSTSPAR